MCIEQEYPQEIGFTFLVSLGFFKDFRVEGVESPVREAGGCRARARSRAMMWRILATLSSAGEAPRPPAGVMTATPSSRSARNSAAMRSCSAQYRACSSGSPATGGPGIRQCQPYE